MSIVGFRVLWLWILMSSARAKAHTSYTLDPRLAT